MTVRFSKIQMFATDFNLTNLNSFMLKGFYASSYWNISVQCNIHYQIAVHPPVSAVLLAKATQSSFL